MIFRPLAVMVVSGASRGPPRAEASAGAESLAMAKRVGLGSSGSSSKLNAFWGFEASLRTAAGCAGAAETVEGATIWLTRARSRQATQTVVLMMMSRTERLLLR